MPLIESPSTLPIYLAVRFWPLRLENRHETNFVALERAIFDFNVHPVGKGDLARQLLPFRFELQRHLDFLAVGRGKLPMPGPVRIASAGRRGFVPATTTIAATKIPKTLVLRVMVDRSQNKRFKKIPPRPLTLSSTPPSQIRAARAPTCAHDGSA